MSRAGRHDFRLDQGADWNDVLTIYTDRSAGTKLNLTGYTARMNLKANANDATPVLALTSGSGLTLGGTAGTITFGVSATTMDGLAARAYVYELKIISSGGVETPLLKGRVVLDPKITD